MFPARAGMIRLHAVRKVQDHCVPRASGDDPLPNTSSIQQSGIVRANSFTLPKRQNRISRPLIFLHFSGSI